MQWAFKMQECKTETKVGTRLKKLLPFALMQIRRPRVHFNFLFLPSSSFAYTRGRRCVHAAAGAKQCTQLIVALTQQNSQDVGREIVPWLRKNGASATLKDGGWDCFCLLANRRRREGCNTHPAGWQFKRGLLLWENKTQKRRARQQHSTMILPWLRLAPLSLRAVFLIIVLLSPPPPRAVVYKGCYFAQRRRHRMKMWVGGKTSHRNRR